MDILDKHIKDRIMLILLKKSFVFFFSHFTAYLLN